MEIGIALSSEDHGPVELVRQAQMAQEHGFDRIWVSDHYHPWITAQGHSACGVCSAASRPRRSCAWERA